MDCICVIDKAESIDSEDKNPLNPPSLHIFKAPIFGLITIYNMCLY